MRRTALLDATFLLFLAIALFSCGRDADLEKNAQHYETRGVVRGISPDRKTLEIQHENIPDFMPSMTMPFLVRDEKQVADLRLGDPISFRITVTPKDFWIDQVRKVQRAEVNVPQPEAHQTSDSKAKRLKEGDAMPEFSLTDQDGKSVTFETFRGRPLVLTFIFTRCAVPTFCPRMTSNFSDLQKLIKAENGPVTKTQLLSITLDPTFDTPQILRLYGAHSNQDPNIWSLAGGDPKQVDALTQAFSVYRQTEGGTLSHGLATALVDPNGKIIKIWRGNAWTPAEIISEIRAQNF